MSPTASAEPFAVRDIAADLRALGLETGDLVFVHAALSAVGRTVCGPRAVIEALQQVVGPDGLVAMPGFSDDARDPMERDPRPPEAHWPKLRAETPPFDPAITPNSGMGAIAEAFRTWPGVVRSPHPAASICAWGAGAVELTSSHPLDWAMGADSPFGALMRRERSKVLLLGVGWNRCSALHTAETFADGRRLKTRRSRVRGADGAPIWVESQDVGDDLGRLFPALGAAYETTGAVTRGAVGHADARVAGLAALIAFATPWLEGALARDAGASGAPG